MVLRMHAMKTGPLTFLTELGAFALTWSERGVTSIRLLPHPSPPTHAPEAPPWALDAAARLTAHLRGERSSLEEIPLDFEGLAEFETKVYTLLREVPAGAVRTYGELASALGVPGAARAVGGAVGRNPFLVVVPCHRVVGARGDPGGFSAPGGLATKARLLALEGITLPVQQRLFE